MAKASTVTAFARKAKSGTARLPAGKKAAVKGAKPTEAATAALRKPAASKAPLKQAEAKRAPMKQGAARPAPSRNAVAKKVAERPAAVAKTAAAARTAAVKTAGAKRTGGKPDVGNRPAAKQAAPRRVAAKPATPVSAARRSRMTPSKRARPPSGGTSVRPPQSFAVSHLNEADFKADGLRSYAQYRDLGIAAATAGMCQAHVIRFIPPCTEAVRKRHRHTVDLQLVYVLKGWVKNEFAGFGEQMMSAGSCWLQPSGVEHTVLDYSPDCEVLEVFVPANFKTEEAG